MKSPAINAGLCRGLNSQTPTLEATMPLPGTFRTRGPELTTRFRLPAGRGREANPPRNDGERFVGGRDNRLFFRGRHIVLCLLVRKCKEHHQSPFMVVG